MKHLKTLFFAAILLIVSVLSFSSTPAHAAGEYITLSAFSGYPGSTIQVSGGGYPANTKLLIHAGDSSNAFASSDKTLTSNALGNFGPIDLTIPSNAVQGSLSISSSLFAGNTLRATNAYYVTPFTPALDVKSASNNPFDFVTVTGRGFMPGESVTVTLATSSATTTADAKGNISNLLVSIPAMPSGTYIIKGVGQTSKAVSTNYFYISEFFASAYPSNYFLLPEDVLLFSGSGFANGETVSVYDGLGTTILSTFVIGVDGSFQNAGGISIPYSYANTSKSFRLVGAKSKAQVYVSANIGQFFPAASPSVYFALPSQVVTFSGSGFAKEETVTVTEGQGITPLATFTTDKNGGFVATGGVTISTNMVGKSPVFTLTGAKSKSKASAAVQVGKYNPTISLSVYFAKPGADLSFSGSGFAPGEAIQLFEDKATVATATGITDAFGGFKAGLKTTIPYAASGTTKTYRVLGSTSGGEAVLSLGIASLTPQVSLSNYYVQSGQTFLVSASDFAPSELITIQLDAKEIIQVAADKDGVLTKQSIVLPFDKAVTTKIVLKGLKSGATASTTLTRAPFNPSVNASNYYVLPGEVIKFTGQGFAATEEVTLLNGKDIVATFTTDVTGALALANYTVPFGSKGTLALTFVGKKSLATTALSIGLGMFYPSVESDNYYALPGTIVSIKGSGFYPGETVTLVSGTNSISATASQKGSFEKVLFTLPFGLKNTANIVVIGTKSLATATLPITLAPFYPQVNPSTYYVSAGSLVNFSGDSFVPGEQVTYSLNKTVLGTTTADAKGKLTLTGVAIPYGTTSAAFSFVGAFSQSPANISIGVAALYASVQLDNYYAVGGSPVTILGSQFAAGETVAIMFGGVSLGNVTATTAGTFSLKTTVPFGTAGEKSVIATGQTSKASAKTGFTQAMIYTSLQLSNYFAKPGTAVGFVGSGYLPGETLEVTTDRTGATIVYTFVASGAGAFNNNLWTIPLGYTEGNLAITVKGKNSFSSNTIVFYVGK